MKTLFFLGHPAHFHLFKHTINYLKKEGCQVDILIKKKDILEELLQRSGMEYNNVLSGGRKDGFFGIAAGLIKKEAGLFRHCKSNRPDLMVGTSAEIAHVGRILGIRSMVFIEDDISVIRDFATMAYPFADHIISPEACDNGRWNNKTVFYKGFQKLAYLHPNAFQPDIKVVRKYTTTDTPYCIIRLAKLTAYHDRGINGISNSTAHELIKTLKAHGNVYITSERAIPEQFEQYRLKIDPLDVHHLMASAKLFVGDSQSMAVEAAMLGTPSIRFSDFTGRIGVLEELEHKYGLTFGVRSDNPDLLHETVENLLNTNNLYETFKTRRNKMLREKIDVTAFFRWFVGNYPESYRTVKEDPTYQRSFMNEDMQI